MAVGLLLSAGRILAHGYDEGLGQLVTEVVGQMMVFVLLAAVELEPLSPAGEHIAVELGAFAGEKIADIHAQHLGDIEQVGKRKIALPRFIGQVFVLIDPSPAGDLLGTQAGDVAQITDAKRDQAQLFPVFRHDRPLHAAQNTPPQYK